MFIGIFGAFASYQERIYTMVHPVYQDYEYRLVIPDQPESGEWLRSLKSKYHAWRAKPRRGSIKDLENRLQEAVRRENYIEAARLRDLISKKKRK